MSETKRRICLAVLLHGGRFSWKYPDARAEGDHDIEMYKDLARTAERGRFDIIFMADGYSIKDDGLGPEALRSMSTVVHFDPLTLLAALSTVTSRIGLVCTGSTTYNEPYDFARRMATLDHMSGGRAGWNVITSQMTSEALNFGYDGPLSTEDRYARAREFLDVTLKLWDSWDDDAFPRDKASGTYLHPERMHVLDHRGRFFKVRGPLNVARMPQGYPLICQAGESEEGREFAAQSADMMYGKAVTLEHGQEFYASMKGRLAKYGRAPESLKIMPGLCCVVGRTREEAQEKFDRVQRTISAVEARAFAVQFMGPAFDLEGDPTAPMPESDELDAIARRKRIGIVRDGQRLSLVELGRWIAACMGHLTMIGTPGEIADQMERFIDEGGSDGFALMPHYLPGNLDDFVELVIPELQRRDRFRTEYEGATLRENLGLPRPPSRYATPRSGAESNAVPVLDLATLSPDGLVTALQGCSCVLLTNHGVKLPLTEAVYASGRAFFALPEAEKQQVAWSGRGAWQGWQRMAEESGAGYAADLVERYELRLAQRTLSDAPLDLADAAGLARWGSSFTLWPSQPAGFRDIWTRYYAAMHDLSTRLVRLLADGLDIDGGTLDAWTVRQWSNLVVNHYPPLHGALHTPEPGRMRSKPHTDIGGLTILWSDDRTGGLEARIGAGGSWVPVHIPPGALLVQAGDLLTRWTGGRIPSNIHRVVNPAAGSEAARRGRFSVVYFHHPDMETTIRDESGRTLVAAEHVRRRQRLDTPILETALDA